MHCGSVPLSLAWGHGPTRGAYADWYMMMSIQASSIALYSARAVLLWCQPSLWCQGCLLEWIEAKKSYIIQVDGQKETAVVKPEHLKKVCFEL